MGPTISIKCILLIFLTLIICCHCQSENPVTSSWAKLEISPNALNSMEYGNFRIEIYEHAHNHKAATTASQKKYFYSPLALLDHKSAESSYNNVTKRSEMRFRVEMWNDKVQNETVKYLNEIVSPDIKSNQVAIIPLEKVILTSNVPTEDYSLSSVWTNYADKSKILPLSLTCFDRKVCGQLANEMRSNPKQFDHFKLLYSLSSQTSQTKVTTISIDSLTSGSMVSKLLQKFGNKKEIFLTASDEKKMLTETVTNIKMETFYDSEVASPDTEKKILNILKDLLITSRTTIKDQSDKMWDSVFWNEDNYRPDKTTKTLNEIFKKLDKETQKKLTDMFQKAERQSGINEMSTSNSKDAEKRQEGQIRRENQSKDAKENENRRSEATEQEQSSRNQTRDEKSKTNKVDTGFNVGFAGFSAGTNVGVENSNAHNTQQENEKRKNEKKNSDTQNRNLENKERMQHNYDANSSTDVDRISSTISEKLSKDSDSSSRIESLKENVGKLIQESRNHVQWDGEKFVPKPMQLRTSELKTSSELNSFESDPLTDSASSPVARDDKPPPIKVSSLQYGQVCVTIYESLQTTLNNNKIYFYTPIALLNHLDVTSVANQVSATQGNLSIGFTIWNQTVTDKVVQHLTLFLNEKVEPNQVQVYPFDSVKLTSKVQSADFSLTDEWQTFDKNRHKLRFSLTCPTKQDCDQVKKGIRNNELKHLRLEFNPKLNDDTCIIAGAGLISQGDLKKQEEGAKQELLENFEAKLAKELNAFREATQKEMDLTRKELIETKSIVDDLMTKSKVTQKELDLIRKELIETKSIVDDLMSTKSKDTVTYLFDCKVIEENLRKELRESATLINLENNLNATRTELTNAKTDVADLKTKLIETSTNLEIATRNLASAMIELISTKSAVTDLTKMLNARTSEIVDIGQMPKSCFDLQRMGHKLSGFFSVKGSKKMEMIYCNFYPNQNEKWIGYADVKSAPVHFYVQRNSHFATKGTPIPFDLAVVNEGNAMDLTTGKFTAPRPGIFFFSFTGVADFVASLSDVQLRVGLYVNGDRIGSGWVEEGMSIGGQWGQLTLQSTLNLKKGDQIWVQIWTISKGVHLYDISSDNNINHYTHFTGFILEEEIVASL